MDSSYRLRLQRWRSGCRTLQCQHQASATICDGRTRLIPSVIMTNKA